MAAARIESALDALERTCGAISPFSQLSGAATVRRRMNLATRAVALIAGEEPGRLLRELCGHNNKTTLNIAEKFRKWRAGRADAAEGGKVSISRRDREWVVGSLSFFAGDMSRAGMKAIGINVGVDLYNSAKRFAASGDAIFSTPEENSPGRKRHRAADALVGGWESRSQPVGRINARGENVRVAHGGRSLVANELAAGHQCSRPTSYRYCPRNIASSKKYSDLCNFCEALRKVRLTCIQVANERGANIEEPDESAGQKEIAAPGKLAEERLRAGGSEHGEARELLQQLSVLSQHEALGSTIAQK